MEIAHDAIEAMLFEQAAARLFFFIGDERADVAIADQGQHLLAPLAIGLDHQAIPSTIAPQRREYRAKSSSIVSLV